MSIQFRIALLLSFLCTRAFSQATEKGFVLMGRIEGADSLNEAVLTRFDNGQVKTDKVRAGLGVWLTNDTIRATFKVVRYEEGYQLLQPQTVAGPADAVDYLANINTLNGYTDRNLPKEERQQRQADFVSGYVSTHPTSAYAAFFLLSNLDILGTTVSKKLLASLSPAVQQSTEGEAIQKAIALREANALGKTIENLTLPDEMGQPQTINTTSKPFTLLYFWASWCGPCRAHNPDLVNLYKQVAPERLQLVSISLDTDKKAWLKAIRQDGLRWTQLSDLKGWNSPIAKQFALFGIPQTILLDQNGRIISVDAADARRLITR